MCECIIPKKRNRFLLKAFAAIDQNEWGLILVGDDRSNGKYMQQAKDLGIQEKVLFTGAVDSSTINEYMSFADVFVLPTRFDGWGVVLSEALSLGMPIISTDECGAAYHVIEDGENGYRVRANSVGALLDSMKVYVDAPHKVFEHAQISLQLFEELTPHRNVVRLIDGLDTWCKESQTC